jgi:hypothetical protein
VTGRWSDVGKRWRTVRQGLGVPEVTTHTFGKTVSGL